ncbi:MAG: sulfatase-like hydrolase/transferase, partial [Candidatus Saccharimonas sp.]|nr:sulfatase-like hydrolase/transferase [Planctomycetaceae bacterium]
HVQNPVPVVMIVFDEFSGTSLMDERLQIDARNFPNFARLASQSTWYRQSSTVHPRTDVAVPAILSGQFPATQRGPVEANYPGNLLQTIHASGAYDMAVFEPITRLCPTELSRERAMIPSSRVQRAANLIQTLAVVYPRLILPGDTPIPFPAIPKPWFGMRSTPLVSAQHLTTGLFHYQHALERDVQQDHLLGCLRRSDRPLFAFFHIMLPHFPWEYLPSGRHYVAGEYASGSAPLEGLGDLGENWPADAAAVLRNEHRYLLQVGYTDRFIGRVLDQLQESGLLDRCLLIVTADHGVSFRPGRSRRVPDAENIADILSVPLFIKRPGQTIGAIDDRNVESVDLYPTIAEELHIQLAEPVDGLPVSQDVRRPRKTLYFENRMTVVEPAIPQLEAAVLRRARSFDSSSREHLPRSATSRPDWHGRAVSEVATIEEPPPGDSTLVISSPYAESGEDLTALLIAGFVTGKSSSTASPEIVLAAGGIICDTYQTLRATHNSFSCLIPESVVQSAPTKIELFLVKPDEANGTKLVRQRWWMLQPAK